MGKTVLVLDCSDDESTEGSEVLCASVAASDVGDAESIQLTQELNRVCDPTQVHSDIPGVSDLEEDFAKKLAEVKPKLAEVEPTKGASAGEVTDKTEAALRDALEIGGFGLRGTVMGNKWARALKCDTTLLQDYKNTKGMKPTRVFRLQWAQQE